jgi:hypothetical protein
MRTTLTFLAVALLLLGVVPAQAGSVDVVVVDTSAAPGTLGAVQIDLVNNSSSAVTIAAFSVDVLLTDTTNVSFTGIDNSVHPADARAKVERSGHTDSN